MNLGGPLYLGTCMNVVLRETIRHYDETYIARELPQNPLQSRVDSYISLNLSQHPPSMPEGSQTHPKGARYSLKLMNEDQKEVVLSKLKVHYLDNTNSTRVWYIESGNLIFNAEDSPWFNNISVHPCIWNLNG